MSAAVLELKTWREHLANAIGEDVYDHNNKEFNFEKGLNFPLKQNMEEVTHLFWLIMLLQIFRLLK